MSGDGRPDGALQRVFAAGLVSDLDSPSGQRIYHAREAARRIGVDELAGAELVQAYARGVSRIVAAEAEIAARAVPADPRSSWRQRMHEWVAAAAGLAVEIFDGLHAQQLHAAIDRLHVRESDVGLRTVAFVDLCGSTGFMLECSTEELRSLIDELFFAAQGVANAHGATVVKYLGDGVVMLASEPEAALDAAQELIVQLAERTPLPAAGGVAHGRVIAHAGDLLGPAMNLAYRLSELARPNEVLVDRKGWPLRRLPGSPRLVEPRGLESRWPVHAIAVR